MNSHATILHFINQDHPPSNAIFGHYNYSLVAVSIFIAILASAAMLNVAERIRNKNDMLPNYMWLMIGTITMSTGVWAMHFVGMLAYEIEIPVNYDITLTLFSICPLLVTSWISISAFTRPSCTNKNILISGFMLGFGVGAMHYIGMMAMEINANMFYAINLFIASIIVSISLSIIAFYIICKFSNNLALGNVAAGATLIGGAVSGTHYFGMSAMIIIPKKIIETTPINVINHKILSIWVTEASLGIVIITFIMTMIGRRMQSAAGTATISRSKLIEAIDSLSNGFVLFDENKKIILTNKQYIHFFDLGTRESLIGKNIEFINKKIKSNNIIIKEKNLDNETNEFQCVKEIKIKGGSWLKLNERHINGIGTVKVYHDISSIKKSQHELSKANEKILTLNTQLNEENKRLSAEIDIANKLQQMVLPTPEELKNIPGLEIAAHMQAADEVGGDYYDVLQHNGQVKIGIGDVTGHGLESGILMMMAQIGIRTLFTSNELNPESFLNTLNKTLYHNTKRMGIDRSLSLLLIDYRPPKNNNEPATLNVTGQHEVILVVRGGSNIEIVDTIDLGFPIGLEEDISTLAQSTQIELHKDDGLVLFTDGITEAENNIGQHYEIDNLKKITKINWHKSAEEIKKAIIDDLHQHIGKHVIFDDITLMILKQKSTEHSVFYEKEMTHGNN